MRKSDPRSRRKGLSFLLVENYLHVRFVRGHHFIQWSSLRQYFCGRFLSQCESPNKVYFHFSPAFTHIVVDLSIQTTKYTQNELFTIICNQYSCQQWDIPLWNGRSLPYALFHTFSITIPFLREQLSQVFPGWGPRWRRPSEYVW